MVALLNFAGSHPPHVIGTAVRVMRIATRDETKDAHDAEMGKNPAAATGRKGGVAAARSLASEQRVKIAGKQTAKRWRRVARAVAVSQPTMFKRHKRRGSIEI